MDDLRTIEEPRTKRIERLWRERAEADQALREVARDMTPADLEALLLAHGWEMGIVVWWVSRDGARVIRVPRHADTADYADAAWRVVEAVLGGGRG